MNQGDQDNEGNQDGSNLNPDAAPFNPYGQEALDAYAAYQAAAAQNYFTLFPLALHNPFLHNYHHLGHPPGHHLAVSNPVYATALGADNAHRLSAPYIWSVFESLVSTPGFQILTYAQTCARVDPNPGFETSSKVKHRFMHENLQYEALKEVKFVPQTKHPARTDRFVQLHVPNNGLRYNAAISGKKEVTRHNQMHGWIPLDPTNASVISDKFLAYATTWFGGAPDAVNMFYNKVFNRIDLEFWVQPSSSSRDRVYLKIAFEPGFPIQPFDADTWAIQNPAAALFPEAG